MLYALENRPTFLGLIMAEAKTKPTKVSLEDFLEQSVTPNRHADCRAIAAMMQSATREKPVMWGQSIVGFGTYHYQYESGREGDSPIVAFSPRKNELVIYVVPGFANYERLLSKLGRHKTGKVCLYIKKLADVDVEVLNRIIVESVNAMASKQTPARKRG
jgi:hypothetical protein